MHIRLCAEWVQGVLPKRAATDHKGRFGRLLMVCGCSRYRGAAALAADAALCCGTGLVQLAATEPVCAAVAARLPCCIYHPLAAAPDGTLAGAEAADALQPNPTALLAGCGLGATNTTADALEALLQTATCPMVLDADALNLLCGRLWDGQDEPVRVRLQTAFERASGPFVLTPHIGEMARLCGTTPAQVQADQAGFAVRYARQHLCAVALKSHVTVVAEPGGTVYICDEGGNPGLAKGGSGDVLAGLIAGLLAQGMAPGLAAAAGVWLHAAAARRAAEAEGLAALRPAGLPGHIGRVLHALGF